MKINRPASRISIIKVGDVVSVPFGLAKLKGKVVEDRGAIGINGRKLYRVMVNLNDESMSIELPAEKLVTPKARRPKMTLVKNLSVIPKKLKTKSSKEVKQ